jgi:hypothetical protein
MTPIKLRGYLERFFDRAGDLFEQAVYHEGWRTPRPVKPPRKQLSKKVVPAASPPASPAVVAVGTAFFQPPVQPTASLASIPISFEEVATECRLIYGTRSDGSWGPVWVKGGIREDYVPEAQGSNATHSGYNAWPGPGNNATFSSQVHSSQVHSTYHISR